MNSQQGQQVYLSVEEPFFGLLQLVLLLPVMFLNRTPGLLSYAGRRTVSTTGVRRTPYAGFRMVALLSFPCS